MSWDCKRIWLNARQKLNKKNIPRGGNFSFGIILTKFWKQRIFWGHILAKETDGICIPPFRLL